MSTVPRPPTQLTSEFFAGCESRAAREGVEQKQAPAATTAGAADAAAAPPVGVPGAGVTRLLDDFARGFAGRAEASAAAPPVAEGTAPPAPDIAAETAVGTTPMSLYDRWYADFRRHQQCASIIRAFFRDVADRVPVGTAYRPLSLFGGYFPAFYTRCAAERVGFPYPTLRGFLTRAERDTPEGAGYRPHALADRFNAEALGYGNPRARRVVRDIFADVEERVGHDVGLRPETLLEEFDAAFADRFGGDALGCPLSCLRDVFAEVDRNFPAGVMHSPQTLFDRYFAPRLPGGGGPASGGLGFGFATGAPYADAICDAFFEDVRRGLVRREWGTRPLAARALDSAAVAVAENEQQQQQQQQQQQPPREKQTQTQEEKDATPADAALTTAANDVDRFRDEFKWALQGVADIDQEVRTAEDRARQMLADFFGMVPAAGDRWRPGLLAERFPSLTTMDDFVRGFADRVRRTAGASTRRGGGALIEVTPPRGIVDAFFADAEGRARAAGAIVGEKRGATQQVKHGKKAKTKEKEKEHKAAKKERVAA